MLTYSFDNTGSETLYEHLYRCIKEDILSGVIAPDDRLPSKRSLAKNLGISVITVENAYGMLSDEGYIYSIPKKGFFAADIAGAAAGLRADRREAGRGTSAADSRLMRTGTGLGTFAPDSRLIRTGTDLGTSAADSRLMRDPRKFRQSPDLHAPEKEDSGERTYLADFVSNRTSPDNFPFATWVRLLREVMRDRKDELLINPPPGGIFELREAICGYLYQFRGIKVLPQQIIVGAGTEYLYSLLIQLLGRDKKIALETPGYRKIPLIYEKNGVSCRYIPMDAQGIRMNALNESGCDILHISPSHHFPTGIVTPVNRRYELLSWAAESRNRYIIEDDYDSEFRMAGKPIPPMQSIDTVEKVIYINTFTKSLASTVRIGYMILPPHLLEKFRSELGFYSCTVSNFEQYTLARFLRDGYFEKHINRMRKFYRNQRDFLLKHIRTHPLASGIKITGEHAGLHFLLHVPTASSDEEIVERADRAGIRISALSQYDFPPGEDPGCSAEAEHSGRDPVNHTLVVNYSGISTEVIPEAVDRLIRSIVGEDIAQDH